MPGGSAVAARLGTGRVGRWWLRRILTSEVELALEILLGDLHVAQGHTDVCVPQQLHESGKTNTAAEHVRGKAVAQLVRDHTAGAVCSCSGMHQRRQKSTIQGVMATAAGEQEGLGVGHKRGRRQRAQS